MSREWKVGDVALVEAGCWANPKVALRLAEGWSHTNGVNVDGDGIIIPVRPLLVIDPEDTEQVDRLRALASELADQVPYDDMAAPGDLTHLTAMQTALRAMLEPPAPPKPDEPTGHWAVVEAGFTQASSAGVRRKWVKYADGTWRSNACSTSDWTDLTDPVIIRPGITPDEPEAEEPLPPDLIDRDGDEWNWCAECSGYRFPMHGAHEMRCGNTRLNLEDEYGPLREVSYGSAVLP